MPATHIRCHVLEVDREDDWLPRRSTPRDLLPWADPYIASLVQRLEQRFEGDRADDPRCNPFATDELECGAEGFDDGWEFDASIPRPLEAVPASRRHPPVYGGFPLLDDCGPTDVADAL
jgi:hypothetical protein